jgi:hypothetical protein
MTTVPRLADRITAIAGSVDVSGFAPFLAPLMFYLNQNIWATITLIVSAVTALLIAYLIFGRRRGVISPVE